MAPDSPCWVHLVLSQPEAMQSPSKAWVSLCVSVCLHVDMACMCLSVCLGVCRRFVWVARGLGDRKESQGWLLRCEVPPGPMADARR